MHSIGSNVEKLRIMRRRNFPMRGRFPLYNGPNKNSRSHRKLPNCCGNNQMPGEHIVIIKSKG